MARSNLSGFETGDLTEFSNTNGAVSAQSTTVRSGTYALRLHPVDATLCFVRMRAHDANGAHTSLNLATAYTRFYFNWATLPASGTENVCQFMEVGGGLLKLSVRIDSTGKMSVWDGGGTQAGSTGTTVLSSGVWYMIGVSLATGANAAFELRINGVTELTGTVAVNSATNNDSVVLGNNFTAYAVTVDFFYDDFVIESTGFPGPGAVVRLDPATTVAATNWTNEAAGAATFASVDDLASQAGHDTDTTYVTTATAGTVTFTVSFTALPTGVKSIVELKLIAYSRDEGTVNAYQIQLRPSSNAVSTTALDGGNTYAMRAILYKFSSGTDALTVANVNTTQASVIKTQSQARALRCTCMAVMADVTPGPHSFGWIIA